MKTNITYKDGVQIISKRANGKSIATLRFTNGETETVQASFPTLLRAKVDVAIKAHYSNVIAGLAKTAREINENAGKRKPKRNVLGAMDFTRI